MQEGETPLLLAEVGWRAVNAPPVAGFQSFDHNVSRCAHVRSATINNESTARNCTSFPQPPCDHELLWTIRLQCLHCVADVFQRYYTAESTIIVLDGHGKLRDGLPSLLD